MATVHRLSARELQQGTLSMRLAHLLRLEVELGLAEARRAVVGVVIAIAVALLSVIALVASVVVLLTGAFAPIFGVAWEPFVIAGGGTLIVAALAMAWTAWRLRRFEWPRETLISLQENWRWLGAQLRSRLTLP
jgi:hypothetical protein